jgi:ribosome-binding factor A
MAHHGARIADRVRRVLAEAIQNELRDPRLGFVTLTDVRLSPDRRHAVAYVSVGEGSAAESLKALESATPYLRKLLAKRAGLRHTPELRFAEDEVLERGTRMEELFRKLHDERQEAPPDES